MLNYTIEEITPEKATEYLGFNVRNRNLRQRVVNLYAEDMSLGNWKSTGDPIRFAVDGTLLDGQHRLAAIVEAGVTITMVVVRGLETSDQLVMDTGSKRNFSDFLKLSGEANCASLAATVRAVTSYELEGDLKARQVSMSAMLETLKKYPELRDSTRVAMAVNSVVPLGLSAGGFCHWLFNPIDSDDCNMFFDKLSTGANLREGDPILALRRQFVADIRGRRNFSMTPNYKAAIAIKAWNKWRAGERAELLRWTPGGAKSEAFPEVAA